MERSNGRQRAAGEVILSQQPGRGTEQLGIEKCPFPSPPWVHLSHSTQLDCILLMFCFASIGLTLVQNVVRGPRWGILVEKKKSEWCQLMPFFFFPPCSLRTGRAEPLAYTVKNYSIFANTNMRSELPLSQHIHQPPTTWQLLSAARQLLSQRSEDFLPYCSLPVKGLPSIRPANHVPWRGALEDFVVVVLGFFPPLLPLSHFGTGSLHISGHGFWTLGFTTWCHQNVLQGGYFPGSHSMHIRISCSRRKQKPPSLQESQGLKSLVLFTKLKQADDSRYLWVALGWICVVLV